MTFNEQRKKSIIYNELKILNDYLRKKDIHTKNGFIEFFGFTLYDKDTIKIRYLKYIKNNNTDIIDFYFNINKFKQRSFITISAEIFYEIDLKVNPYKASPLYKLLNT